MLIPHKEFSFIVGAPNNLGMCKIYGCHETNCSFAVIARNDKDEVMFEIDPVCEKHILTSFIDALTESN